MSFPPPAPTPAAPIPAAPRPEPVVLPGAEYPQMLGGRSLASRWWRPIVAVALAVAVGFVGVMVVSVAFAGASIAAGSRPDALADPGDLWGFTFLAASLAVLIPTTLLAIGVAWWIPPTRVLSVVGRLRWGWFATCVAALAPLWVVALVGSALLAGDDLHPEPRWWAFALLVVFLIPFQAAAEELAFRVLPMLAIGSWLARWRWLALLVPIPVSTALFVAAHGSADPWIVLDLGTFAVVAVLLTWWTGGVEAAIALHTVNNVVLMLVTLVTGGFAASFVSEDTAGDPISTAISMGLEIVAGLIIAWLAHRRGLTRRTPVAT